MHFSELMAVLSTHAIHLQREEDDLIILGDDEALDDGLIDNVRAHKAQLLELITRNGGDWLSPAYRITPQMLPLTTLDQATIDQIVDAVPGGLANVKDIYPLAPLQEGMLYHHLSAERGDPYLLQSQYAFDSRARLEHFIQALQYVIKRHDILRTTVAWESLDEPVQVVLRKATLNHEELHLDPRDGDVLGQLRARFDARHYRLDIREAPMMRVAFALDSPNQRWVAVLLFHHMALDHTAMEVVQHEMQAFLLGQTEHLGEPVPYRNYVAQALLGVSEQQHETFFREMLGDIDEPTLPFGLQDVQGDGHGIEESHLMLDNGLSQRLRVQARQMGVSAASVMHLAMAQVLGKVSGRQEVVFGTVLLGRMHAGEGSGRALGMFINTLPLRVSVGEQSVRSGLKLTHQRLTALLQHEHASLALAQRCSGVAPPTPLFSAMLNYRHSASGGSVEAQAAWAGMQALGAEERTNYPLTVNLDDLGEDFHITVLADAEIGASRVAHYLHAALDSQVAALEHTPEAPLHSLGILPATERQHLLQHCNSSDAVFADSALIHAQFEAQAAAHPDACALVYEDRHLSYGELNRRANQVAHRLLSLGVHVDDRVAICVERGLDMIIGLLGILKAGAGYVPIDPAYPQERIRYTLQDSAPVAVLVQQATHALVAELSVPVIDLDACDCQAESTDNPDVAGLTSANLAYVIYTSGSTGLPKGVMIEHRNVARLFSATEAWFNFDDQDVWALFHSFAFDFSVWEIWGALMHGGQLLVVPQLTSRSPDACYALLCSAGVTILNQTPSAFRSLIAAQGQSELKHALRQVIFGGEALEPGILKPWYARSSNAATQLVNMYGITETTVHVTYRALEAADARLVGVSPIGGRIPDLQLYVLDEQREPVPVGVVGELYVGGAGVARGYLNRPELNAERFIADPFSTRAGARLYRSGDLGRRLADGSIDYLGRNDDQVKIRGFRIELGEIEARLAACDGVREAVVIAREDEPGDQRLVAYLIACEGAEPSAAELRQQLLLSLAEYMVPAAFVRVAQLPLTTNGKLDRKALPAPDADALARRQYAAPEGEVEATIAAIWQDLLGVERVGREDHFFELGGHSLLAVKLIERMRQVGLGADVRVLFGQPTLAALAAAVAGANKDVVVPANRVPEGCEHITPDMLPLAELDQAGIDRIVATVPGGAANVQEIYSLAPLQEGILYHHLAAAQGDPYLQYATFSFDSRDRLQRFAAALQGVISRHDILRTAVVWERLDEPVQVVWREAELGVDEIHLDPAGGDIATQLTECLNPRHHRLDIRQAPMMRIGYSEDAPNQRWVAVLLLHHLVDDATSLRMLTSEIEAHTRGEEALLAPSVPYRNYVAQARQGVSREEHEAFFTEMLGDIDEPTLPFGLQDVQGDGHGVEEVVLALDDRLSQRLRAQSRQLGVTPASLYHLAWARVLGGLSGRNDVVFGTVLLGRLQGGEGSDRALGMFINTLPLRVSLGEAGVRAMVKSTHTRLTGLLGHEHASLVLAQRCSKIAASTPLFSSLLNYRQLGGADVSAEAVAAWEGIAVLDSKERTNYPLTLSVNDMGEAFSLSVMADGAIGAARVCSYMQCVLDNLVQALEQTPQASLRGLGMLPALEREHLLQHWNATDSLFADAVLIHHQVELHAAERPDATAVLFDDERLSYGELNRRANQVAHRLLSLGVRVDDRVAICVDRGLEMIVGLLGILKAGAGYVPIDPAYPQERISYTLQDSAPVAVLVQQATHALVAELSVPVIDLDSTGLQVEPVLNPHVPDLTSASLAYVIYTSGSTGLPKGVMIEHRNVARLFSATEGWFNFNHQDVWALFHSFAFDFSVWEIWGALIHGGQLLVVPQLTSRSPDECYALLCSAGVTILNQTPSAFRSLMAAQGQSALKHSLRQVIFGGEALEPGILKPWYARTTNAGTQLVNMYGITETTVHVTYRALEAADAQLVGVSPIGGRIPDLQLYVLDDQREPVPVGVVGELYVGGAGVARGYLNRPELNAERFIADPFSGRADARLYKTGDLGRWLADGSIDYLGRNDDQVKIRGFRIELGEIQARLAACDGVREAVVIAREDAPGNKRLVAYVIAGEGAEPSAAALRTELLVSLADYMVPSAFVMLERLPLTTNGKLDRKALPAPDSDALARREYERPEGDVEQTLAVLWQELLDVARVGRHDNFFELGGHSLLAVKLIERMRQIDLSADVRVLFGQPTLAALAAAVGGHQELVVPANLIGLDCSRITPDLLPLADLDQAAIDRIVASVPGGARNVQDIYALAPLQDGMLYHHLAAPQGDAYLLHMLFAFTGPEPVNQFAKALQSVIDRHDILRSSMVWDGLEEPVQVVWRQATLGLEEVVIDAADGDVLGQLHRQFDPRHYRLDMQRAPLMHLAYTQDSANQRWVGILLFHHMMLDHTALEVLIEEVQASLKGHTEHLAPSIPYRNHVAQSRLGADRQAHERFFTDMLADIDEPTLAFGLRDVQGDGSGVEEAHLMLDSQLSARLREQARLLGVSAASLMHLAWGQVLAQVAGRDDVVFGTVLLGRLQGGEGAGRALGLFINTLPLRVSVGEHGAREAVRVTHERLSQLLAHEHASLSLAQQCSGLPAAQALFNTLLNYRHSAAVEATSADITAWDGIQALGMEERTNYPLVLNIDDFGAGFQLNAQALEKIGAQRVCGFMQRALAHLVDALEDTPQRALNQLSVLSAAEREAVLVDVNATAVHYPEAQTIHRLFEAQVERQPDATAVCQGDQHITYRQLNQRANQLAHRLLEEGVRPDDRVAICARRSLETLVGLVAILKAGAAYVPIDPAHPQERIAYLLQDCAPMLVLAQSSTRSLLGDTPLPVIELDSDQWHRRPTLDPSVQGLTSANLAYVIYTSGSTGLPKGVMVEHRTLENLVHWHCQAFNLHAGSHTSSVAGFGFDAMAWEVWPALCVGATLHLPPAKAGSEDIDALLHWWLAQPLDVSFLPTPVAEYAFSQQMQHPSLKTLLIGGDRLRQFNTPQRFQVVNNYGPTEATVVATSGLINAGQLLHIGKPIANTQVYLLDAHLKPVPKGVVGELYVGGAGVARGYLNRPELTAERFLRDPFSQDPLARLYRTGDLARWLEEGTLDYLGRNDDQVKIRGVRIELGEIESRLSEYPDVSETVVLAREGRLVAYFTEHQPVDRQALRSALQAQLPEYMVPTVYVRLDSLPLTANGKLDRKALPVPDQEALLSRGYAAPEGEVEIALAQIWSQVLKVEQVGREDHFFELGGHSLLAMRLISQVRLHLGVELDLAALFAHPQLSALAQVVAKAGRSHLPAIVPVSREESLPLSFAQQRLWFLAQMDNAAAAYNMPIGLGLRGALDALALERALAQIVSRHEVLRSAFVVDNDEPQLVITPVEGSFVLMQDDLREQADAPQQLQALSEHEALAPFDLVNGPLLRARLVRLGDEHHVLLLTVHHIAADGWSMGVLTREMVALYGAYSQGLADPLPPLALQYADFAVWQRRWLSGEVLHKQNLYWQQTLAGAPAVLTLPTDRPRPAQQDFSGAVLPLQLDASLSEGLKALSQRHGTTLYMTLLAAWAVLLSRLSGQDEVVIGSPVANRNRVEVEGLIGLFVNTLAVRIDASGEPTVQTLLARVKTQALGAQAHQDLPFEQVVDIVKPVRSMAYSPLFQTMLTWQGSEGAAPVFGDLRMEDGGQINTAAKFDLSLELSEAQGHIIGSLSYATALFDEATLTRHLGYFERLLQAMVSDDQGVLARVPLLDESERQQQLAALSGLRTPLNPGTVHSLFEAQAVRTPDALAVQAGEHSLSYRELNERANQLAHHLRQLGVQPDARVAICVERSPELIVGLLAILKAGGAYVPIDANYPLERIHYMLQDSAPAALLVHGVTAQLACTPGLPVVDLDGDDWREHALDNPQVAGLSPTHLTYVIYTSGSTGQPKGVMVEHQGVVNMLGWYLADVGLDASDAVLLLTSHSFDLTQKNIFASLAVGATLHLADSPFDPVSIVRQIGEQAITHINLAPSAFYALIDADPQQVLSGLRRVVLGGEPIKLSQLEKLQAPRPRFINSYGPTECSDVVAWHAVDADLSRYGAGDIPLGQPLRNLTLYVLDAYGQPVPTGSVGELYIGGAGVARGYLNREALTAERFLDDPHTPGGRMYRTGDLARYRPDGTLDYLGRNDDQVKIRGLRIELGEIEALLAACPEVIEAAVLVRDERLVAYFTGQAPKVEDLRTYLQSALPEYMVPSAYVQLAAWPLSPNGKMDRKALPAPGLDAVVSGVYEAPEGELETTLAQIWQDLLGLEQVGRQGHFFELGGHSLLAMRLISQVRQRLGVELSLAELFAQPQLAALAQVLAQAARSTLPAILAVPRDQDLPLSFAQQRLWFLAQMEGASTAYNMPIALGLRGHLDAQALERALAAIVARHEALRSRFVQHDDEPRVRIDPVEQGFALLRLPVDNDAALQAHISADALEPFDLEQGPLIRASLLRRADDHHVLLLTMHHIVSDGWSMGVLTHELMALYEAFRLGHADPLPPLALQYSDFAVWQRRWLSGEVLQQQSQYWQQALADAPALLMLPTDRPRPARQDYSGATLSVLLDVNLTAGLKALSQRHGTTLYMTMMAAWAALLCRLSGQDEVVIGSPAANRMRAEVEGLIGLFVNTLAVRIGAGADLSVAALLAHAKDRTLAAQAHQDLPFEQVVEVLKPARSLAHSPIFQTLLTWQNSDGQSLVMGDLQFEGVGEASSFSKFDLSLDLSEVQGHIAGALEYATALFDETTMQRYLGYFERLLQAMVADDQALLAHIPLLDEDERDYLLHDLNANHVAYPHDSTLHQLFEAQVEAHPQAIAVAFEQQRLSYAELNRRANRLAHQLIGLGVGPDDRVAICAERGDEVLVGLLGVLKAGAAYVPLDPNYPPERLAYMIADSTPSVVLSQRALLERLPALAIPHVLLDAPHTGAEHNPQVPGLTARHLAYVIYTSGSTGNPKGVMIEHRGLVNYSLDAARLFGLTAQDTVLQQNTLNFDLSVEEIFPALLAGATLAPSRHVFGSEAAQDPAITLTVLHLTAAHWHTLAAEWHHTPHQAQAHLQHVRLINVTGDALSAQKLKLWDEVRPAHTRLINTYGPTEATVSCTAAYVTHSADTNGNTTIGKPMANTRIYLLDSQQQPVPLGVAGEIFIGGDGVARGYLNLDAISAERFIADPFSTAPGARMYKTGDLARYLADGSIEYLGRNDFQVKVRGFRIELGEIEARLGNCAGVKEAAVIAREDLPGEKRLVAYVVPHAGVSLTAAGLRSYLAPLLAEYMIPSAFVTLDALPLTPNRKLDRKALPAPDHLAVASRDYQAPEGRIERSLALIWAQVLQLEQVGRHDNFFELGGHSLLAVKLVERMRQEDLRVDVGALFTHPTLAGLAKVVGSRRALVIPANGITAECQRITPQMLPLASLGQDEIDSLVAGVPGQLANVQDIYGMTPLQEGILYHHLLADEGDVYLEQASFNFDRRERLDAFAHALQGVVERNDILRSTMRWEGLSEPVQVVLRQVPFALEEISLEGEGDAAAQLRERFHPRHLRMDLRDAPLMRLVCAYDGPQQRWSALFMFHHMLFDHVAMDILQDELQAFLSGQEARLNAPVPYRNYVAQARLGMTEQEHEAFFSAMLADIDEPTLPFGLHDVQAGGVLELAQLPVEDGLGQRLRSAARQLGVSAASLIHVAWAQVLAHVCGQDDVVFGTVLMGGMQGGERALGLFINTLPLRVSVGAESAQAGVKATHARLSTLLSHEHASLALAQRCSGVAAPAPLFSALLNYRHSVGAAASEDLAVWAGIQALGGEERSNYPLSLDVDDFGQAFALTVQVSPEVGAQRVCAYMHGALDSLVDALERTPNASLSSLEILPLVERRQVLLDFNQTRTDDAQDQLIHGVFEQQVLRNADAIALEFDGQSLTYGELNAQANQLAHHLIALGVQPDDRVAIALERGTQMVVALLASLKAGAAYVPLDPAYPPQRLAFMLADSAPRLLLSEYAVLPLLGALPPALHVVTLNSALQPWRELSEHNPLAAERGLHSEHLAYVLYTSGSTGTPKGVMIEHAGLCNEIRAIRGLTGLTAGDRALQFASINFDASIEEIFGALTCGATLVLRSAAWLNDAAQFWALAAQARLSVISLPTRFWQGLADDHATAIPACVRVIVVGGEELNPQAVQHWFLRSGHTPRLLNTYGPTEATIIATANEVCAANPQPRAIGRPIANTRVYVLDAHGHPTGLGVAGEIHLAGAGIARGYLNQPQLSSERFLADPFNDAPGRLYKTGDLGRWLPDGTLEYLGRNDDQVKIRGFRIELGEVESALLACEGVRAAVVMARDDSEGQVSGKQLVAYLCGTPVSIEQLREELLTHLPQYMMPSAYVQMDSLPVTPNGKLDRKALPAPEQVMLSRDYEAPADALEARLASQWAQVLKLPRVGRHDSFFEMGGHSLLAIRLVSLLAQAQVQVTLAELFQHASVASMAALLRLRTDAPAPEQGLVTVRAGGTQAPLFLVHEFSGLNVYFPALGQHLDADVPVYGLEGVTWGAPQLQTMECLAARHIDLMRTVQPHGPYRLAGWSFGGVLAYEIAAQLIGMDEEVSFLGLLDTHVPRLVDQGKARWSSAHAHSLHLLEQCRAFCQAQVPVDRHALVTLAQLEREAEQLDFNSLLQRCRDAGLLQPQLAALSRDGLWAYLDREVAHGHAQAHYSLFPLNIPVHLFTAEQRTDDASRSSETLGWDQVVPAALLQRIDVPGDHQSMMQAPHIAALGQAIGTALGALPAATNQALHQPVLTIQSGQAGRAPIFCIPGAGDSVTGFIGLTDAFGPDWPIHGLQPRGLDAKTVPHSRVESAAQAYRVALEQQCPVGPVHLLGHSFGGWVAFEVALRLQALGREVLSLTLVDSEAPGGTGVAGKPYTATGVLLRLIETMQLAAGKPFGIDPQAFASLDETAQLAALHGAMVRVGMLSARSTPDVMYGPARTFGAALRTVYQPRSRFNGPIRLVLADDPTLDAQGNQREQAGMIEGWSRYTDHLETWYGPGNHFTLLKAPYVYSLASWWHDGLVVPVGKVTS
ncbi:non-ribosomal peptide synthase/polyketide synthase [Pseudomonas sp. MWU15-20650]|uniref:non-ribosomal peptide synthase/polyketide synthase n=1 Tax=Pseudomonas sp. MWU15-20650 TaxID=2933107 RepID=UPI00200CE8D5|nr:non-ribosomal peptide synthase/polyketide synthase [Pseudomonas sp. MWU15-20650]